MDALFGSNALAGPVGKEVERATDEMLLGPDWSINLDLVDMVKSRTDGPKSVCLAVRKRIKDGSPKQALLALTVIETCVKNCSFNVHNEVAQKEFMTVMCEVARGSKGREAQTQALALIQQWGIAFHSKREALPLFADRSAAASAAARALAARLARGSRCARARSVVAIQLRAAAARGRPLPSRRRLDGARLHTAAHGDAAFGQRCERRRGRHGRVGGRSLDGGRAREAARGPRHGRGEDCALPRDATALPGHRQR